MSNKAEQLTVGFTGKSDVLLRARSHDGSYEDVWTLDKKEAIGIAIDMLRAAYRLGTKKWKSED